MHAPPMPPARSAAPSWSACLLAPAPLLLPFYTPHAPLLLPQAKKALQSLIKSSDIFVVEVRGSAWWAGMSWLGRSGCMHAPLSMGAAPMGAALWCNSHPILPWAARRPAAAMRCALRWAVNESLAVRRGTPPT